ncbi:MAG: DUF4385 domain-containing protein [Thermomicrobiales bacterium]
MGASMSRAFDYDLNYDAIDFRQHPELYRVGRGEQGVLMVQPYKGEILPHWRFRTPEIASESSAAIWELFAAYRDAGDFVGMDMARKFLQMGFTRARRYANHRSGRKYDPESGEKLPQEADWQTSEKAESARIFKAVLDRANADPVYQQALAAHRAQYG